MNIFAPISSLMTDHKHLITVAPEDNLTPKSKKYLMRTSFTTFLWCISVKSSGSSAGLTSNTFMGGASHYEEDKYVNRIAARAHTC
jgi:hypothetical protein